MVLLVRPLAALLLLLNSNMLANAVASTCMTCKLAVTAASFHKIRDLL